MLSLSDDEVKRITRRQLIRAINTTVLASTKARYLSVSEVSAIKSTILEYADIVCNYVAKK